MRRSGTSPGAGRGSAAVAAVLAVVLASCTLAENPTPAPSATADGASSVDLLEAEEEALEAQVEALRATVAALRESLAAAAEGDDEALRRAGRLLAADLEAASDPAVARAAADDRSDPEDAATEPGLSEGEAPPVTTADGDEVAPVTVDGLAPLLPGPVVSRSTTVSYGDLLTTTLAAARGAGSAGEPVAGFLATPLAGDLGAWQRAPADLLALIAEAGTTTDIEQATTAVLDLDGEAPRALAWVVHGLTTSTPTEQAANRAAAHLAVIELALEDL